MSEFRMEIQFIPYFDRERNEFNFLELRNFPQLNGQFYAPQKAAHP